MLIPRKKILTKNGSSWLKWAQVYSLAVSQQGLLMQMALQEEACPSRLPHWAACLHCVPAIQARPYKGVPGILYQPIRLRLPPSNRSCAAISPSASSPTNQRGSILTNQDSASNCKDLESSFARGWTSQGPGIEISLYVSQLPSGLENEFALSNKVWRLLIIEEGTAGSSLGSFHWEHQVSFLAEIYRCQKLFQQSWLFCVWPNQRQGISCTLLFSARNPEPSALWVWMAFNLSCP